MLYFPEFGRQHSADEGEDRESRETDKWTGWGKGTMDKGITMTV